MHSDREIRLRAEIVALIPALTSFARRFERSPQNAEDVVQETLARALGNLDKFQEGTRLKSWLFTILRNTFCTKYGLAKREPVGIEDCASLQPCIDAPQEWALRSADFSIAVKALPAHYRQALDVVLLQGHSYDAAAALFGCPVGTVKSRVNRARSMVLARLDGLSA